MRQKSRLGFRRAARRARSASLAPSGAALSATDRPDHMDVFSDHELCERIKGWEAEGAPSFSPPLTVLPNPMTSIAGRTYALLAALCLASGCGSNNTSHGTEDAEANGSGGADESGGANGSGGADGENDVDPDPGPDDPGPTLQQAAESYCQLHSAECGFGEVESCLSDMQAMVSEIGDDDSECGQAGAEWIHCLGVLESCDELMSFDSGRSGVVDCLRGDEQACDDISDGSESEYPCASEDRAFLVACIF